MLLKNKDGRQNDIQALTGLLTRKLTAKQRFFIERELKFMASGDRNEQNSAYYLDFRYKDSPNYVVIHDLRLEHRGKVAQIDHLLINRYLDIFVLESKSYYYGVKITDEGEFLNWDGKGYQAIESPYEQNKRHILALQQSIEDRNLGPRRLGFAIPVSYRNIVLVSPTSKLLKPTAAPFDLSSVVKADAFVSIVEKEMDRKTIVEAAKIVGSDTLLEFGEKLVRLHRPGSIDYAAKFGVQVVDTEQDIAPLAAVVSTPEAAETYQETAADIACRSCKSIKLSIMYGKFGYYFKCADCDGNTPIKISCGKDGHSERIRKDGSKFFRECQACATSNLYFVNP